MEVATDTTPANAESAATTADDVAAAAAAAMSMDVAAAVADAVAAAATSSQSAFENRHVGPPPPPLPPGWLMKQSRSNPGYYYYFHMDTGMVSWDPPIQPQQQQIPSTATEQVTQPITTLDIPQPMEEDTTLSSSSPAVDGVVTPAATSPQPPKSVLKRPDPDDETNIATTASTTSYMEDDSSLKQHSSSHHHRPSKRRKHSSSSTSHEPKEVRCLHILKKHKDSRRPSSWRNPNITQTKEEAHAELQGLLEILKEEQGNPKELRATFEELARTESDCSSAKRGGDLGYFGRKKMQPAFEDASFALQKNEMTQSIVDTSSGSHIILRIG